ncbi:T-cell immunomodulatory protein-like [Tropilaelaps mercedesae]|uniref:T-cell immunomodulatory protein-like n=1 Tax=Tropilaelaps mercedesae TaxID=418985 RepID=A0A1V9XWZ8_9ACAR|nr:T-cell immunomodulatory protein-like [Tropilaelaps mercedesae]
MNMAVNAGCCCVGRCRSRCCRTFPQASGGRVRTMRLSELSFRVQLLYIMVAVLPLCWGADGHFRDVSAGVFQNQSGYLAAFADFNSDKAIDVFVLTAPKGRNGFRHVAVNEAQNPRFGEEQFLHKQLISNFPVDISGVMPADLNGDQIQDVLVYSKPNHSLTIFWGTGDFENPLDPLHNKTFPDAYVEPLLLDYNGNRYVDILTSLGDDAHRTLIECKRNESNKTECDMRELNATLGKLPAVASPHSNSFVDLNGDLNTDLLVSTKHHFEVWIWQEAGKYSKTIRNYPNNRRAEDLGQSVFVDFNSTGRLYHIVQVCNGGCNEAYIWLSNSADGIHGRWEKIIELKNETFWKDDTFETSVNAMMSLKAADFDQDGYPDFATIVRLPNGRRGLIGLVNRKCSGKGEICVAGRTFQVMEYPGDFGQVTLAVNLGFFDIRENGKIDVLVTEGDPSSGNWTIKALENVYTEDVCFIKVIIVSGLCGKDNCNGNRDKTQYGYNQPGPLAMYTITDSEAKMRSSAAAQLYQTSHGALQLPYILFGIGLSPNFVESLEVRMPGLNKSHQWTQIIPNSQMLVIPNPIKDPSLWQNKLFITPSRKMLHTGLALCGVVLVNLTIVLALHLMEKKADRIEKQQQAHRFNFDAM